MRRCNWLTRIQLLVIGLTLSASATAHNASTFVDLMTPDGYQTYREFIQLQHNGNLELAQAMASALISSARANDASTDEAAEQCNVCNVTLLASLIIFLLLCFLLFNRHSHKMRNQQLAGTVKRRTQELERKNEELQQAYRTLEHMSLRDALTGCYNRHYLDANLPAEINRSLHSYRTMRELGRPAPEQNSLLGFLIDIDNFKTINDTHGHVTGDKFLVQFANIIAHVFRHSDLKVRWGGEEFLVICRNTMRSDASILAERLRAAVSDANFISQAGANFKATCSIGFTAFPLDQENEERITWEQTFQLADHCLCSAKASHKNCWVGVLSAETVSIDAQLNDNERNIGFGRLTAVTSLNHVSAINWHIDIKANH